MPRGRATVEFWILDFGFWIAGKGRRTQPSGVFDTVGPNPKSKIQNPKSRSPSSVFLDEVSGEDQAVAAAERFLETVRGMRAHRASGGGRRNGGCEPEIRAERS